MSAIMPHQNILISLGRYLPLLASMQDLIIAYIDALELSMAPLETGALLSYQERNQLEVVSMYRKYFHNIRQAYLKCPDSKIHQKLLEEYTLLGNSLWSASQEVLDFATGAHAASLKSSTHLLLSHFNYQAQSPLLALYCQIMGHRITLHGSRAQVKRGWSASAVRLGEVDKASAFANTMASQGIQMRYFEDENDQQLQNIEADTKEEILNIEIVDLFNTHPSLYRPYVLSRLASCKNQNKIFIYYAHPAQQDQVQKLISQFTPIVHRLQLSISFPYESTITTASKFEHQLLIFLNEELNYPNKQDIIIFHPCSEEFVKKVKNMVKKQGGDMVKHTHIVARPNQNRRESLPPAPSFITKMLSISSPTRIEAQDSKIGQPKSEVQSEGSEIKGESDIKNVGQSSVKPKSSMLAPKQVHTHNNIFIAPNYNTLMEWGYDLSHVFYIFDFRRDRTFHFDYELMTYVQTQQDYITDKEGLLRVSCMGANKIGKYCFVKEDLEEREMIKSGHEEGVADRRCKDIGAYCLQMINGKYTQFWEQVKESKQIYSCVQALAEAEIIKKEKEGTFSISRPEVLKCVSKIRDFNPIMCVSILNAKNGEMHQIAPSKLAILLAMASSILMTDGCLRQVATSNNAVANRPTQIWRQTGYLHSCLDILVRAKIIEHREHLIREGKKSKKSVSKRISKQTSQEWDVFGNLFQIVIADRITFDQMKVEDLLREELINETAFHIITELAEKICDLLGLEDFVFSSFEDINFVMVEIIKFHHKAIGAYSGSRRVGYLMKGQQDGIFPNKFSLLSTLNEHPQFVHASRLLKFSSLTSESKYQILMCNSIPEMTMMESIGMLPSRKTNSYGESQIQYHGIASATFKALWRNDGADILSFEEKFSCFVEPNEQIALISIHCPKEKEGVIESEFNSLLAKIKDKLASETKIMHYLGTTSILFGAGGRVVQPIKDKYINKCSLSNLDLSVTVEDLQELFEQFFHLKEIKVVREPPSANFKTAFIQFHTQKDYYRFHEYYNECLYLDRYLRVTPIESIPTVSTYKEQMHLEFTWTAWKSNGEAIVEFESEQSCAKCLQGFKEAKLDGKKVKMESRGDNKVYISGLNSLTDQINLQMILEGYGKIKLIEILKTPVKENLKSLEACLQEQIRKNVQGVGEIEVKKAEKLKNGLRKCRVIYKNEAKLNETIVAMNQKTGLMGVGRVHLKSWFVYPIKVAHGYISLYQDLVGMVLSKLANNRIRLENIIYNEQQYIIAKSNLKQEIDIFKQSITQELRGYDVPLSELESSILLTEVGIRNLVDLEEKYNCKLIPDFTKKTLLVLALFDDVKTIKQQIKAKVQDNFFYRISLNQKSFKHFKQNPQLCETLKKQYFLQEFQLEEVGRNLLLEGSANFVEKAFNYLMHLIESISKPSETDLMNPDACMICAEDSFKPYRFQQCGHKFCIRCVLENIETSLNDITMFPLKCPGCYKEIAMADLEELLTPETWVKLKNIALNQYVGRNPEIISSCYTAGCKQVNFLIKNFFNCDECQQSYCLGCKLNYHPGLTCEEAKNGGNLAFEKYMKENGIRKCPNQSCKMPIMRSDGCYRVTCSRCNKSMCFKCEPQKMIAYDHYNDCYKHLTDVHGGYW